MAISVAAMSTRTHPTKVETLMRAVTDVLAPVGRELRELGYDAELIGEETEDGVTLKLVVVVTKNAEPNSDGAVTTERAGRS